MTFVFQFIEIVASLYGLYRNAGAVPILDLPGDVGADARDNDAGGDVVVAVLAAKADHANSRADTTPKVDRRMIPDCSFFISMLRSQNAMDSLADADTRCIDVVRTISARHPIQAHTTLNLKIDPRK
ncbi:hypothetical protein [Burkholderia ubonensis]|uniref:hypothetical protein n=1 Tax=Burkholderia ubonensis TaxID=101571 RepID=UPI001E5055E5|nr:hypothetical protein [Burkholderia ubonensis]